MTNIYILAVGSSPPAPWTRQTAYDGRYVKFAASYGGTGTTGGASTHTHSLSNKTVGNTPYKTTYYDTAGNNIWMQWLAAHTHSLSGESFGTANNSPLYYTMALWYMDMATWEATERRFPAGAILMGGDAPVNSDQLTRHTASDGRSIMLGNPGSTGGADTHTHAYSFSLSTTVAGPSTGVIGVYWPLTDSPYIDAGNMYNSNGMTHAHGSATIYTSTASSVPYTITTRLYHAVNQTTRADAGVMCFADGAVGAYWNTRGDWAGFFLRGGNTNAAAGSSSTHGHTLAGGSAPYVYDYYYRYWQWNQYHAHVSPASIYTNHYHDVSATVANDSTEPLNVQLFPITLNTTLYHVNVYTLAETDTVRIKKVQTRSITPDMLSSKAQTLADPMKMLLQKFDIDTAADLDARVLVQYDLNLDDVTARLKKPTDTGISASVIVAILSNAWDMTMRLVRYWNPAGKPILDSIMKGWIDEIQTVDNKIQVMYLNSSLDYAIGSELDSKWGEVYELPRLANESDDEYRKRIKTYVTMETGSGTKATIEAVLDTIVEEVGASRVETYTPGRVKIFFDTGEALHHASVHKDLIDYVLPQALSVGVYYELYLTFVDYLMDIFMQGFKDKSYEMDHLEAYANLEKELYMYVTALNQIDITYDMDSSCMTVLEKVLYVLTRIQHTFSNTYTVSVRSRKAIEEVCTMWLAILNRFMSVTYDATSAILKENARQLDLSALALKTREAIYIASVTLI